SIASLLVAMASPVALAAMQQETAGLFDAAQARLSSVPSALAMAVRERVALFAEGADPTAASLDARIAFQDANQLLSRAADAGEADPTHNAVAQAAGWTEVEAMNQLVRSRNLSEARTLAATAVFRRGHLYDILLLGYLRLHQQERSKDAEAPDAAAAPVLELVRECGTQGDAFPFLGASAALAHVSSVLDRRALASTGYRAASELPTTDANQLLEVAQFFRAAHARVPALDGELAAADASLIRRLEDSPNIRFQHEGPAAAGLMISVLAAVAPSQAASLRTELAWVRMPGASVSPPMAIPSQDSQSAAQVNAADLATALGSALGMVDASARFSALLQLALYSTDPAVARRAGEAAAQQAAPATVSVNLRAAARLAVRMQQNLGLPAQARALMLECVAQAEAKIRAAQAELDDLSSTAGQNAARDLLRDLGREEDFIQVFGFDALLAPDDADKAARSIPSDVFAPLALAQVGAVRGGILSGLGLH